MRVQGSKGKQYSDRQLAGEVRDLALNEIKRALLGDDVEFKKAVVLRLAGSLLPRLNEVSGPDGAPIPISNVLEDLGIQKDSEIKQEN